MDTLSVTTRNPETNIQQHPKKALLLYDGECPLCQWSIKIFRKLDWFRRIQYQNARDFEQIPLPTVTLDRQKLLEEMHLVEPDGSKVQVGYRAVRAVFWRLPLTWLVAPLLYIPGLPFLGQKIYLWVARNRFQLVPCKQGACTVPPKKSP